jgi:hypothetical protein
MNKKFNKSTLKKYSTGKYSYKDYLDVKEWFSDESVSRELEYHMASHWEKFSYNVKKKEKSLNYIFDRVLYDIGVKGKTRSIKSDFWNVYRQIAAVLFFPVIICSVWYSIYSSDKNLFIAKQTIPSWVEINAPKGARVDFMLPDSTRGCLNSGSTLKYFTNFHENRKVELSGEAWFDVVHNEESQFVVDALAMDIVVLGTQFNVCTYPEDQYIDVTLEQGRVEIQGKVGVFNQVILPNEKFSFNKKEKSLVISAVDASRFSSWKEGLLVIDNEPLGMVVNRLERWYNIEVDIQNEKLKKYRFKATFKDEPLDEVLKLIAKTTPIDYKIEEREVNKQGILKQKKVRIKLKQ